MNSMGKLTARSNNESKLTYNWDMASLSRSPKGSKTEFIIPLCALLAKFSTIEDFEYLTLKM